MIAGIDPTLRLSLPVRVYTGARYLAALETRLEKMGPEERQLRDNLATTCGVCGGRVDVEEAVPCAGCDATAHAFCVPRHWHCTACSEACKDDFWGPPGGRAPAPPDPNPNPSPRKFPTLDLPPALAMCLLDRDDHVSDKVT